MRWVKRGLEACAALPPSENHLQGDFKNNPVMLQDKSLITGNYGLSICSPGPPPPRKPSASSSLLSSSHSTAEAACERGRRDGAGGGHRAITWEQTVIMAADALLHFHSCGVAHLWAAITHQIIQTGPCDGIAGLTESRAALFFACVRVTVSYAFKHRTNELDVSVLVSVVGHTLSNNVQYR